MKDNGRVFLIFSLNLVGCLICCGFIQLVIYISKKMNAKMIVLRKNYKQYRGLMKFKELRKAYNEEQETFKSGLV